jgi:uncharacterized protein YutE (UPF0331/DUF86 family)
MSTVGKSTVEIYADNMAKKIAKLAEDLDDLSGILGERALSRHEYHSAERLVQVLVEACIGLSKHWVKSLNKEVPNDAYQSINRLKELGYLSDDDALNWRKIIGLRNTLMHDYLNIESGIIKKVIEDKFYSTLITFAQQAITHLQSVKVG